MKTTIAAITLAALAAAPLWADPMGTAFTHQGRLYEGGTAASGFYDFRFTLYDSASGGTAVSTAPSPNPNVLTLWVTNGLFTTPLDFGPNAFLGAARWLSVEVKPDGDAGPYETLAPRQELKPTAYALFAGNASSAARATTADSATTAGTATTASSAGSVPWSGITGMPPGFADGVDNDHIYTEGPGLTLAGSVFSVNFGGTGTATTAARSDHDHFGQSWVGNASEGLVVNNQSSALAAFALHGRTAITTPGGQSAAVRGENAGTADLGFGVWGSHAADGIGVFGEAAGGKGVLGSASATTGTGIGVQGLSSSPAGTGVSGRHESAAGTAAGVLGETASTESRAIGVQGTVVSTSPGSFSAGVRGVNNSTGGNGIGVYGSQAGSGWGVYGETPTGAGVRGECPSGVGVLGYAAGTSGSNIGVSGITGSPDGYGVYAAGSAPSGTALGIGGGGIRVVNAGVGTATPVFTHQATAGNISGPETRIDHVQCNGKPNAILIVNYVYNPAGLAGTRNDKPVGLYYNGSRWAIYNLDSTAMPVGAAYNVLVVNP